MAFWRATAHRAIPAGKGFRRLFSAAGEKAGFASRGKTAAENPPSLRCGRREGWRCKPELPGVCSLQRPRWTRAWPSRRHSNGDRHRYRGRAVPRFLPHRRDPFPAPAARLAPQWRRSRPRPLPDEGAARSALEDIFDALVATFSNTPLEPDLENLLWSTVNLFHRGADRIQQELDRNEDEQKRSQKEQDGSEIRSVELERLIVRGQGIADRRDTLELFRDRAADIFDARLGSSWRPHSTSKVNHKALTATMIESRDFIAAKRRADIEPLLPPGPKIAFAGGLDCNDCNRIFEVLDKARAKHPGMVLLHGGSPKGAEFIASRWADHRKVAQIAFKPDWNRHAKSAPFKRNDQLLQTLPIGIIVFPGSGITDNLADKARTMGIPVWRFGV